MKTMIKTATILGTLCLLVSPVMANFSATLSGGYGQGGAFNVSLSDGPPSYLRFGTVNGLDTTFCVENVEFSRNVKYTATVDDVIEFGKLPGAVLTLTDTTKNLFAWYAMGGGDAWVGTDATRNAALQGIFWDEQGVALNTGAYAATKSYILSNFNNLSVWSSSVRVLNLWNGTPYTKEADKQSHLVIVPAPAAVGLGLLGLGLVGWVKRRMA